MQKLDSNILVEAIDGNLCAFSKLLQQHHGQIQTDCTALPELIITSVGLHRVLLAMLHKEVNPKLVQSWASFVKRGYVSHWEEQLPTEVTRRPITRVDISYEPSVEDEIVEVLGRLDEIGDLVDGEITDDEILAMIASLSGRDKELDRR